MTKLLESHRRDITAVFCDLRGFTAFAERAEPEDIIAVLQEYYQLSRRIDRPLRGHACSISPATAC